MQQERGEVDVGGCGVHRPDARGEAERRSHQPLEHRLHLLLADRALAVRRGDGALKGVPHKLGPAAEVEDEEVVRVHKGAAAPRLDLALAGGEAREVHLHRAGAVDDRAHRRPAHRLVEVPLVHDVAHAAGLEREGRVRPDQHRHARRAVHEGVLLGRVAHVGAHGDRPPPVPRRALHPVGAREQRRRAAVAGVVAVDALDVGAAVRREERHQVALHALGPVEQRLGPHLQHAHVLVPQALRLDQPPHRRERHRHDVLVLVARGPLGHPQPDRVLARHAVRGLELGRRDGVARHVHLERVQAGVAGGGLRGRVRAR